MVMARLASISIFSFIPFLLLRNSLLIPAMTKVLFAHQLGLCAARPIFSPAPALYGWDRDSHGRLPFIRRPAAGR